MAWVAHLFQDARHRECGHIGEIAPEIVDLTAVRITAHQMGLIPREPLHLLADVLAAYIFRCLGGRLVRIVEADKGDASVGFRIVQDLPEHARGWRSSRWRQIDVDRTAVNVGKIGATLRKEKMMSVKNPFALMAKSISTHISSRITIEILLLASGKRAHIILQRIPIATVERLPLWCRIRVHERRHLVCTMHEIRLRHQMALGQEMIVGQRHETIGQLL